MVVISITVIIFINFIGFLLCLQFRHHINSLTFKDRVSSGGKFFIVVFPINIRSGEKSMLDFKCFYLDRKSFLLLVRSCIWV